MQRKFVRVPGAVLSSFKTRASAVALALGLSSALVGCGIGDKVDLLNQLGDDNPFRFLLGQNPYCLETSSWTPDVSGAGNSNHDTTIITEKTSFTGLGPVIGLEDAISNSAKVRFDFEVSGDLGSSGSITLDARVVGFSKDLVGWVYPILVGLVGPSNSGPVDYINLNSNCFSDGLFVCGSGTCGPQGSSCDVSSISAYLKRDHWQQNNVPPFGFNSTNTFPTCNWDSAGTLSPQCQFNNIFFDNGKLRPGSYQAVYVLVASSYASLPAGSAQMELKVSRKRDITASGGAIDLNVVFVGSKNVADSATSKGRANLDLAFEKVHNYLNQTPGIELGRINAYNWGCDDDNGDEYAIVDITELGELLRLGSQIVYAEDPGSEGKAINIFLVSSIESQANAGAIVLGAAGSIGGPLTYLTGSSGVVIRTGEEIASHNPLCAVGSCPEASQSPDFKNWVVTISHELGHYLGLNHPSESSGESHDWIPDTPQCGDDVPGGVSKVSHDICLDESKSSTVNSDNYSGGAADCNADGSCSCSDLCPGYNPVDTPASVFCPAISACQFNHMMWFRTKKFKSLSTEGDGAIFSPQSAPIMNYHGVTR